MRVILITGKGGVGKTTVSAATAIRSAELGYRSAYSLDLVLDADGLEVEIPLERGSELELEVIASRAILDEHWIYLVPRAAWEEVVYHPHPGGGGWWDRGSLAAGFFATHRVRPGKDGLARVVGLEPGSYRLRFYPEDIVITPDVIEVGRASAPVRIEIRPAP